MAIKVLDVAASLSYSQNNSLVDKPKTDSKINFYSIITTSSSKRPALPYSFIF